MARKNKIDMLNVESIDNYSAAGSSEEKHVNPNSLKNLQTNHREKSPTKYMQVNVYGYDDYLYRMARYHRMTTTKYLLSLIKKDAEEHAADYQNLKNLSEYDKPHRESPNKRK